MDGESAGHQAHDNACGRLASWAAGVAALAPSALVAQLDLRCS